jgi:hypothetical protein
MASLSDLLLSSASNMLAGLYINAQTGTTYTFALADAGCLVTFSNGSAIAVTVPTNASVAYQTNSRIWCLNIGAGQVTIAGDVGVTVNQTDGLTLDQYEAGFLVKTATDTWTFVKVSGSSAGAGTTLPGVVSGRLTLTDGTPVTTADVLAATTLYFEPYKGEYNALYTGAAWEYTNLGSGLSIAVPATTSTMYDVWLDYNGGTPQLVLDAWTNDTTRATALTTQDGVYVKTGATDHLYLGSFRTTGVSGQTEDSAANRLVWNYYNRVARKLKVIDATNTWNYSLAAWQQANGSAANQVGVVIGVVEEPIDLTALAVFTSSTATVRNALTGIGVDSTTVNSADLSSATGGSNTLAGSPRAVMAYYPSAGYHYYPWLEMGVGTDTQTWRGDDGGTNLQCGLVGTVFG